MQLISKIEVLKVDDDFTHPIMTDENFQQHSEQFEIEDQKYYLILEIRYFSTNAFVTFSEDQLNEMANSVIKNMRSLLPFYLSFGSFDITLTDTINGNSESAFSTLYSSTSMKTTVTVSKYINFTSYIKSDFSGEFTISISNQFPELDKVDEFIKSLISLFISKTVN